MPLSPEAIRASKDILAELGDISGIKIFRNQVLAATYVRPEKTAGGIILTDNTRGEDIYQSKVGMIIKMGPQAFVEDEDGKWFNGEKLKVGDWIIMRPSDGWTISIGSKKVLCRWLDDNAIRGQTENPKRSGNHG